jgi:hypothetical protein
MDNVISVESLQVNASEALLPLIQKFADAILALDDSSYYRLRDAMNDDLDVWTRPEFDISMDYYEIALAEGIQTYPLDNVKVFRLSWKWTIEPFSLRTPQMPYCPFGRASA